MQDSTKFQKIELKQISKLLTETSYRRDKDSDMKRQLDYYGRLVSTLEYKDSLNNIIKNNLNKMIENVKPQFWDRFWIGAVVSSILFLLIR